MELRIDKLKLRNFKGIKERDIDFSNVTDIKGANGTGKTTIGDAFSWLLFDKDSKDRAHFEIKTLEDGEELHGLDHTVEGIFSIDGKELSLKKTYKEKWTKRRGDTEQTFSGHETERLINDVPVKKAEYEKKIGEVIDEKIFKLITDPRYFSENLDWKDRRETLFELAGGDIEVEDVLNSNPELIDLKDDLEEKTADELRKSLSYQRKELNKKRTNIPVKIETLNNTIKEIDVEEAETKLGHLKDQIKYIEEKITDASKLNNEKLDKQNKIYEAKRRIRDIEEELQTGIQDPDKEIKAEVSELNSEKRRLASEISTSEREISSLKSIIEREEAQADELRSEYKSEAEKQVNLENLNTECPTCNRPLPEGDIESQKEKMVENFNNNQVKKLESIRAKGKSITEGLEKNKTDIEELELALETNKSKLDSIDKNIKDLESDIGTKEAPSLEGLLSENEEYQELKAKVENLESSLKEENPNSIIEELKSEKSEKESELKLIERDLHQVEINKDTRTTIDQLMEEEKEVSQAISEVEKKEMLLDKLINEKSKLIEEQVNTNFNNVSFRLFERQVNGGLKETCDVLVDGVPFTSANTAGQVNAGLDVINSLCRHHNTYAPIFIDNRESVQDIIDVNSQVVNLIVSDNKDLQVEEG